MDIKTLSEILGHTNTNITLSYYVHSSMQSKRKQMNRLKFHMAVFMTRNAFSSSFVYIPSAPGQIIPVKPDRFRRQDKQEEYKYLQQKRVSENDQHKKPPSGFYGFQYWHFSKIIIIVLFEYIKISPFIRSIFMKQSVYTGKGIGVVLLDTGIYPHMDFCDRIYALQILFHIEPFPMDDNGHGTCVAGILGEAEASMGKYKGNGTGCSLMSLKVLDRFEMETRRIFWRRFGGSRITGRNTRSGS